MLGLTVSSTALVYSIMESLRSEFAKRVVTAGGTVEDSTCLLSHLDDITKPTPNADILRTFQKRVQLAGGYVESPSSVFDEIEDLRVARSFERSLINDVQARVTANGGHFENLKAAIDMVDSLT